VYGVGRGFASVLSGNSTIALEAGFAQYPPLMSMVRRQYPFHLIEPKWQRFWEERQSFRAWNPGETLPSEHPFARRHGLGGRLSSAEEMPPKYFILDMFPYPSGAGLHVGHPEGYTATDILARYRRARGWHVLHPMGWDAFGLPAEQYAIKTGQHPRITSKRNIATFKRQIQALGFSYDWSREVDTTDPGYFRWTQWIFLQLYNSYFDPEWNKATPIALLEDALSDAPRRESEWRGNPFLSGTHKAWIEMPPEQKYGLRRQFLDRWRLAYVAEAPVWWCEALGTVLANEDVVDGKSEVGGHPVVRRPMRQWMLRITAYAERLLADLDTIDWSPSLKDMQRNWIGRSDGAEIDFVVASSGGEASDGAPRIRVFTTRPDTLFGATYMVLSPEHKLMDEITTPAQREAVLEYKARAAAKSDLDRTDLSKEKTGVFTGGHAFNPATGERIPIWIADYVLASYGTGAIMAVPAHDTRDYEFARKFSLPIVQVVEPPAGTDWRGYVDDGVAVNSAAGDLSLNGLPTAQAKARMTEWLEAKGLGVRTVTTSCATGFSAASATGASPSRSSGGRTLPATGFTRLCPNRRCLCSPPSWTTTSRLPRASPRWPGPASGFTWERAFGARPTRCRSGRAVVGITCASWTPATTPCSSAGPRSGTGWEQATAGRGAWVPNPTRTLPGRRAPLPTPRRGRAWTCTWAGRSTRFCICFTPVFGTRCSMISGMCRRPNRSIVW